MSRRILVAAAVAATAGALAADLRAQTPAGQSSYRRAGEYVMSGSHHIRGIRGTASADNPSLDTCKAVCDGREDCKGFSRRKPQQVASFCLFYDVTMQEARADRSLVPNRGFDYYEKVGGGPATPPPGGTGTGPGETGGGDALSGFTRYERRQIDREDRETTTGTAEGCAAACRQRPWCRSFEKFLFRGGAGVTTCYLSDKIPGDAGVRVVEANWDLYVRSDAVATPAPEEPRPPDGSNRTLEADRKEVRQGEVTRIYIRLKNPGGVANMNYEIRYDPAVARPEGEPLAGNLLRGKAIFEANPNERGRIRIGFAGPDGLDQDGTVAVIPFRATGQPGARTALTLATPIIHDAQGRTLSITRVDGAIEIPGDSGPGGPGPGPQKPEAPPLDCDGNQKLTAFDADCALEMSVGKKPVKLVADVDGDGEVTSGDARILIQRYQGQKGGR